MYVLKIPHTPKSGPGPGSSLTHWIVVRFFKETILRIFISKERLGKCHEVLCKVLCTCSFLPVSTIQPDRTQTSCINLVCQFWELWPHIIHDNIASTNTTVVYLPTSYIFNVSTKKYALVIDFGGPSTNQVSAGNFVTCFIKKIGKWGWVVQLVESWLNYAIVRREESTTPISLTPGSLEACAGPWFVLAHVLDGYYLPYMWGAGPGQAEVLAHVFGCITWPTGLGIYYVISNIVYQTRNCSSIKRGQTIHRYSVLLQFN